MGNSVSTNACLDVEDLQESTEVALAVVQSLEPAHTPPQDADANYLRQCLKCGNVSYLRQGVCLSPQCTDSYLSLPADEVGRRLQSWGKEDATTKNTSEQMEESRKKRLARDDWSGSSYKRSRGRKHAAWSASFRKGVHPRTGKEGMDKPVWWKGEYWIFQPKQGWVRTIQDADPAAEPKAAEPKAAEPKAAEPKASGSAPELSKEAQLRLEEAREAQNQRLEEQERRRHAAEANIGLPTSARPPVAKKETLVQLYQAASVEGKQLAYNAMAKALAKEPQLPKTETSSSTMEAATFAASISKCVCRAHGTAAPWNAGTCTWITNAPTGQSSEFGDLWESWTKDAPYSACAKAKGTFACMCCEWDCWWYHWRRRRWRANQRWLNGSKLQSSSMRWAVIAAAKKV